MYESIVVGADGLESAGIAVERAFELARATACNSRRSAKRQPPCRSPSLPALLRWTQVGRDAGSPRACRVCEPNEAADCVPHESRRCASRRHREERRCR
jgi:hypothetical protein